MKSLALRGLNNLKFFKGTIVMGVIILSISIGVGISRTVIHSFEPPSKVKEHIRPLGEWEEKRRLVLVFHTDLSEEQGGAEGQKAIRDSYFQVIRDAISHVNVTVVLPSSDDAIDLLTWIHKEELGSHLRDGSLVLESIDVDTRWIRDYGALLARGEKTGKLYGLDLLYPQNSPDNDRRYDEKMMYRLFRNTEIHWIIPPLKLDGGNFDTDGMGLCFTSTDTLGHNEDGREEVAGDFRQHLGCRETVFLQPIPLESTAHLDMFFKILSPDLWILGEYHPNEKPGEAMDHLENLAHRTMEKNAAILQAVLKKRGKGHLVRMTMPRPNSFLNRDTKQLKGRDGHIQRTMLRDGKPYLVIKPVEGKQPKMEILFASYVNSIYLHGDRGEIVIVPSYDADEHASEALAIYQKAYPRAKIIRMPSEYFIRDQGAAHCVLYAMPENEIWKT